MQPADRRAWFHFRGIAFPVDAGTPAGEFFAGTRVYGQREVSEIARAAFEEGLRVARGESRVSPVGDT
jgi:hypothetical protein